MASDDRRRTGREVSPFSDAIGDFPMAVERRTDAEAGGIATRGIGYP
jgi:hypothetical protein